MTKTVRVGLMPGRINEFAVETGTSVKDLLAIAGLDATGYEIKVDGATITSADQVVINETTNLVLLVKAVKGNREVRIGLMPGRINEYAVEEGTTVQQALAIAGLDANGYEIKVDGNTASLETRITANTSLILLVKAVKGNK